MRSVHRVTLRITDQQTLTLHGFIRGLHVAPCRPHLGYNPDRYIELWYEVDGTDTRTAVTIHVEGTGHTIDHNGVHVGTVITAGGELIWHVYTEVAQ